MAFQSESASSSVKTEKRHRSIFEVSENFFDSSALIFSPHHITLEAPPEPSKTTALELLSEEAESENRSQNAVVAPRLTCNTCKSEFDSLQDQRSHFKCDIHRFNVKLSIAGKSIVKEEDFDELTPDSFKDFEVSSISGSEDEAEKEVHPRKRLAEAPRQKLFILLPTGERVSVWKCLVTDESEDVSFESNKGRFSGAGEIVPSLKGKDVVDRFKGLVCEPRDGTCLRILLLVSGGHFAGCVFDGNSVVAHKTFHRYVVRAKAGKKQSSNDASGRAAHSAGASLRRYNELALKNEIQELLAAWKPYFDASSCVFVKVPSNSRQLLFSGGKPCFSHTHCTVRHIPLTVRRPTLKEARRLYDQLTQITHEVDENEIHSNTTNDSLPLYSEVPARNESETACKEITISSSVENFNKHPSNEVESEASLPSEAESGETCSAMPLHEAARSNNADEVLELLEEGLDPCTMDERGRTPYMLTSDKEVRNTFRRFMALNLDRWDWHAAKVPSALTKEMEESQAVKQAEKDAKRKARAKELKKLRKTKEKKAQAEAAELEKATKASQAQGTSSSSAPDKRQPQPSILRLSKEEELRRKQAAEREKRAAAAERRMAATTVSTNQSDFDALCSCCGVSLAGKVPFHRYSYKYCTSSCMHVHSEMLQDE